MDTASLRINLPERVDASRLAGPSDCVLRSLEQRAGVSLVLRGSTIKVSGPSLDVETAVQVLHALFDLVQHGRVPSSEDAARLVDEVRSTNKAVASGDVLLTHRGRSVGRAPPGSSAISRRYSAIRSPSASVLRVPAKPTLPWRSPWPRLGGGRSAASF